MSADHSMSVGAGAPDAHLSSQSQAGMLQQPPQQLHQIHYQQQQQQQLLQQQQQQLQQQQLQQQQTHYQHLQPQPPAQQGHHLIKLICSFKSDLPNEIDFAMRVATVLANSDNFSWSKDYPLIDAICSSLPVFVCVCENTHTCHCFARFWRKVLGSKADDRYLQAATNILDLESPISFEDISDHRPKDQSKIYKRIRSAAELLKHFSMATGIVTEKKDKPPVVSYNYNAGTIKKKKPKASLMLLKFISLLLHCEDATLNIIGLDTLSNIASKLAKLPETMDEPVCLKLTHMFQDFCIDAISSQDGDIYIINRSIEIVSMLTSCSNKRVTAHIISLITERDIVPRVEQFLTTHHDVSLFLSALEFCYRISRHQSHLLASGKAKYLIKILVNLLSCEDDSYFTTNALDRIKLMGEQDSIINGNGVAGDNGRTRQESPLSVSIRLTAALILRNLATQSPEMRQTLEFHEAKLSEICMTGGRDESKIIAECLSLITSER